jgi:uncharacterized damage-inducible protein DinB
MPSAALRQLRMLTRYNAWANARLFEALAALPAGEVTARRNHGTHSMGGTLGHAWVVNFRFVDGGAGAMTRGDMLLHVVNHKTYHRGYVADMLYQAGSRPPVMDLPVFLRDVPQHHDARS